MRKTNRTASRRGQLTLHILSIAVVFGLLALIPSRAAAVLIEYFVSPPPGTLSYTQIYNGGERMAHGASGTSAELINTNNKGLATSDFGINKASAIVTGFGNAYALSEWTDEFTISGGAPGTWSTVRFGVTVHGTLSAVGPTDVAKVDLDMFLWHTQDIDGQDYSVLTADMPWLEESMRCDQGQCGDLDLLRYLTGSFTFYYDEPFFIRSSLEANASGFVSPYSDFSNTVALTFLDLPEGATMSALSGATYPVNYQPPGGNVVPEPGTWLLMAFGFVSLAVYRKKFSNS